MLHFSTLLQVKRMLEEEEKSALFEKHTPPTHTAAFSNDSHSMENGLFPPPII